MTSPIAPLITDEDGEDMDYHAIASGLGGEIPNEYVPETLSESIARILVPQLAPVVKECSPKPVLSEHITPSLASEGGVPGQTERRRSSSHSVSTRRGSNGKRITSMSASAQDELDSTLSELKMVPSSGSGHTEFARKGSISSTESDFQIEELRAFGRSGTSKELRTTVSKLIEASPSRRTRYQINEEIMDEERKAEREANLDRKKHARKLWVKTLALARLAAFEKQ